MNAKAFLVLLIVFSSPALIAQNTLVVPSASTTTIQSAINLANPGDTVLVLPGTYYENINFSGKSITVTSQSGPTVTTINGGGLSSVVTFAGGETRGAILSGFTLTHGYASFSGGGISISNAAPTIRGNIITNNLFCADGGGIYSYFGAPLIQNNTITNNQPSGCSGGGGGGIYVGGASSIAGLSPQIIGNTIANNTHDFSGGAIELFAAGQVTIQNNIIYGNNGGQEGGGIAVFNDASPVIVDNLIYGNTATSGGGLYWVIPYSTPGIYLLNNTIASNTAQTGSAIYTGGFDTTTRIVNNLIIGTGTAALYCTGNGGNFPNFSYNDVFTPGATAYGGVCADLTGANGNLSADPQFVSVSGADYRLLPASPAVDGGNNAAGLPALDLAGNQRVQDGNGDGSAVVDIGAYELPGVPSPAISIQPTFWNFGNVPINTVSATETFTVSNLGTGTATFTNFAYSGPFSVTNNCGTSLAAKASCTLAVTFNPATTGPAQGAITITDNATGSPHVISMSGTGTIALMQTSVTSLAFGNSLVGIGSASQTLTIYNTGTAPLQLNSISYTNVSAAGPFIVTNGATPCSAPLQPQASCSLLITFKPLAVGPVSGAITFTDNAPGSPHTVPLSGNGTDFQLTASPASLSISGGQSASYTFTVTPLGGLVSNVGMACSVPAGLSCAVNPSTVSLIGTTAVTGRLTVTTNKKTTARGSYTVALTGQVPGVQHTASVSLSVIK